MSTRLQSAQSMRLQSALKKGPWNNFSRFETSLMDQKQWLLKFSKILCAHPNRETFDDALLQIQYVLGQVDVLEYALQHLRTVIATPPEPSRQLLIFFLKPILQAAADIDTRTQAMESSGIEFGLASPETLWIEELDHLHHLLTKTDGPLFRNPM